MLIDIVNSSSYGELMRKHIQDLLIYLFEQEQNFGILCKIEYLNFDPELPKSISGEFRPMTLFFLAGYTFESARIEQENLIFRITSYNVCYTKLLRTCFLRQFRAISLDVESEEHQNRRGNEDRTVGSHDNTYQQGERKRVDDLTAEKIEREYRNNFV